jgi:hypothetical protein
MAFVAAGLIAAVSSRTGSTQEVRRADPADALVSVVTVVRDGLAVDGAAVDVTDGRPRQRVISTLLPHVADVAHAVRMAADPRRSRERIPAAPGRAGVSGFVLKTSPPEQFIAAIRAAVAGDALLDPAVTTHLIAAFAGRPDPSAPDGLSDADVDLIKLVARMHQQGDLRSVRAPRRREPLIVALTTTNGTF